MWDTMIWNARCLSKRCHLFQKSSSFIRGFYSIITGFSRLHVVEAFAVVCRSSRCTSDMTVWFSAHSIKTIISWKWPQRNTQCKLIVKPEICIQPEYIRLLSNVDLRVGQIFLLLSLSFPHLKAMHSIERWWRCCCRYCAFTFPLN